MNVLIIGKGGREHALAWKLSQSELADNIYVAPGSAGIASVAKCVALKENDFAGLVQFAKENSVGLTIVGPEQPLVDGIVDMFEREGLPVFGPGKEAALIEGSKSFAKHLMKDYKIPTATYEVFYDLESAEDYVKQQGAPIVIKADGLAAGKGVVVAATENEALTALQEIMGDAKFGAAGNRVVIEEFLEGEEFSLMAFVNGTEVHPMVLSQDHKRAFENDEGPNTGGMGAFSPVPQLPEDAQSTAMKTIMEPTAKAMVAEGHPFLGILYAGLILTDDGPKVIEFNARFGDPETQVVLPRLKTDLLRVFLDVKAGKKPSLAWDDRACAGVVLAAKGYPGSYEKGFELSGLESLQSDTLLFHAGTKYDAKHWTANGGRLLLTARLEETLSDAISKATDETSKLAGTKTFYRSDIGHKALTSSSKSK